MNDYVRPAHTELSSAQLQLRDEDEDEDDDAMANRIEEVCS